MKLRVFCAFCINLFSNSDMRQAMGCNFFFVFIPGIVYGFFVYT